MKLMEAIASIKGKGTVFRICLRRKPEPPPSMGLWDYTDFAKPIPGVTTPCGFEFNGIDDKIWLADMTLSGRKESVANTNNDLHLTIADMESNEWYVVTR